MPNHQFTATRAASASIISGLVRANAWRAKLKKIAALADLYGRMPQYSPQRLMRFDCRASATLSWANPQGEPRITQGHAIDVSRTGVCIEVPEPLSPRTIVQFVVADLNLHGSGSVRYCHREGLRWKVGLEFTGGLQWSASRSRRQAI